MFTVLKASAV